MNIAKHVKDIQNHNHKEILQEQAQQINDVKGIDSKRTNHQSIYIDDEYAWENYKGVFFYANDLDTEIATIFFKEDITEALSNEIRSKINDSLEQLENDISHHRIPISSFEQEIAIRIHSVLMSYEDTEERYKMWSIYEDTLLELGSPLSNFEAMGHSFYLMIKSNDDLTPEIRSEVMNHAIANGNIEAVTYLLDKGIPLDSDLTIPICATLEQNNTSSLSMIHFLATQGVDFTKVVNRYAAIGDAAKLYELSLLGTEHFKEAMSYATRGARLDAVIFLQSIGCELTPCDLSAAIFDYEQGYRDDNDVFAVQEYYANEGWIVTADDWTQDTGDDIEPN